MTVRSAMTANQITAEILIQAPRVVPCILWRSNRIDAMAVGRGGNLRRVSAGIDGQGDITGIMRVSPPWFASGIGVRTELEIKTTDRLRPSQVAFRSMITAHGGIYLVITEVESGLTALREAYEYFAQSAGER